MNTASGAGQTGQALRRLAVDDRELRGAQAIGVARDRRASLLILLHGDRLAAAGAAQPFDGNGAAAGADVPETLAGKRHQAGERGGAHLALGERALVDLEGAVGQARRGAVDRAVGAGDALDRDGVERCEAALRPGRRGALGDALGRPIQVLEHPKPARAEAEAIQQLRDRRRRGAVAAEEDQPRAGRQMPA